MASDNRPTGVAGNTTLVTVLIVVAVLYFARTVLIPLALALLLAFLLAPLVIRLRHWGLGRVPAAILVVLLAFGIIGVIGAVMTTQLSELAHKLPEYQQNVHKKMESVRSSGGGLITRITREIRNVTDALTPPPPPPAVRSAEEKPVPVEIRRAPFSPLEMVQKVLGSLLSVLVTAGIVIVFVIFMLIEREDLRDRLIRLAGARRVNLTTNLLDDAAHRVSRYLLAQLIINVLFGVLAGTGLYFLRIPNPFLWGMLAAIFRYVPYLGIWIAALMPAAVAFAVEPGWVGVPMVFGLYFGIDLLMYNFAEPVFYGSSTGVSPLAILVAAVFWTWLWGPIGLLLATPLTVCVVVIGRHVPPLRFLQVMLSDEPVLSPPMRLYQRMLAMELEEATEVAEEFLKGSSLERLYDQVLVPALSLAEEDRHQGKLDEQRQQFIFQNTRILIEDLGERAAQLTRQRRASQRAEPGGPPGPAPPHLPGKVVCLPARDEADALASLMLTQLLAQRGIQASALAGGKLIGELLQAVERERPAVTCVSAVPPLGYMHARYLCRRLQSQFSGLRLVAAILSERDVAELKQRQPPLAANEIASSLHEAVDQAVALLSAPTEETRPALAA